MASQDDPAVERQQVPLVPPNFDASSEEPDAGSVPPEEVRTDPDRGIGELGAEEVDPAAPPPPANPD